MSYKKNTRVRYECFQSYICAKNRRNDTSFFVSGATEVKRGTQYRAVLQTRFVPGGGREIEGGEPIGKGWMAEGTGQLSFLFEQRRFSYFRKERFLILVQKQYLLRVH